MCKLKKRIAMAMAAVLALSAGAVVSAGTPTYDVYKYDGEYLLNVECKTTLSDFYYYMNFNNPGIDSATSYTIRDANGSLLFSSSYTSHGSEKVKTGIKVEYNNGYVYEVVVAGDVDGNGAININDVMDATRHTGGKAQLKGAYFRAADVLKDGKVTQTDVDEITKIIARG